MFIALEFTIYKFPKEKSSTIYLRKADCRGKFSNDILVSLHCSLCHAFSLERSLIKEEIHRTGRKVPTYKVPMFDLVFGIQTKILPTF